MSSTRTHRGGFTLVELIVALLVLAILAGLVVLGYGTFTDRAQGARAQANLSQLATVILAQATATDAPTLDRPLVTAALEHDGSATVTQGISAGTTWHLGFATQSPSGPDDVAVAFDNSDGIAQDTGGSRAILEVRGGSHTYARVVLWGSGASPASQGAAGQVPDGTTPAQVATDPTLIGRSQGNSLTPVAPQDVTRDGSGTLTWAGHPGSAGTWCVDFLTSDVWVRQGCTTTNSWAGAPAAGSYSVYWRPLANSTPSPQFCPALTFTQDWNLDPTNPSYGVWVNTSGVPASHDWSKLTLSAKHYAAGHPDTPVDSDPNVYASASGWTNHVMFTGGANAPASGLVPGDIYVLAITGPGVYTQGCELGFTAQPAPTATNGASGWTSQPLMHVWWQNCGNIGCVEPPRVQWRLGSLVSSVVGAVI